MTITAFSIEYDAINDRNTFTSGDTINGRVIVEVSKETTVQALVFIGQAEARVRWSEHHGDYDRVYWQNEQYYEIKRCILSKSRQDGTEVIGKGRHVFPFSFQIPDRNIPSTFNASVGKVVHKLKAELKQPMRPTKRAKTHFRFQSKPNLDLPGLMEPQYGCKDKSLAFNSGSVAINVFTDRLGYMQGEALRVTLDVANRCGRSVKPKFTLYEKQSFFAQGKRRVHTRDILKGKAEAVGSSQAETVTQVIHLPAELPSSILNCSIIKLEYRLKVYLDIKFAKDPEVKLPIVVLPSLRSPAEKRPPASAAIGLQAFGGPDQSLQTTFPQQRADQPPSYEACALYPPSSD